MYSCCPLEVVSTYQVLLVLRKSYVICSNVQTLNYVFVTYLLCSPPTPSFEEEGVYCLANVGWSVRRPHCFCSIIHVPIDLHHSDFIGWLPLLCTLCTVFGVSMSNVKVTFNLKMIYFQLEYHLTQDLQTSYGNCSY